MIAHKVFMVRPAYFGYNPETAENNAFQHRVLDDRIHLQTTAQKEFDQLVSRMRKAGIRVDILLDDPADQRLDAIFPNNWFSTHPGQTLVSYPMFSPIRRRERDPRHLEYIIQHYSVHCHIALEHFESEELFLEGTGSLIIDHEYGVVYANRSPRTHEVPFTRFCQIMGYTPVIFDAEDIDGIPIYHTNVVMGIGQGYIIINRSAIAPKDWPKLEFYFQQTNKTIIEITHDQMTNFMANVAFLYNTALQPYIVMSDAAFGAMDHSQHELLSTFGTILHSDLTTIEKVGGGSAKCMIAENYLESRG